MAARTFKMHTTVEPLSLLARARRVAKENGATLVGGKYQMAGQTVTVTITNKHWLVPWPVLEARLRELVQ